jgi:hypothetical protein
MYTMLASIRCFLKKPTSLAIHTGDWIPTGELKEKIIVCAVLLAVVTTRLRSPKTIAIRAEFRHDPPFLAIPGMSMATHGSISRKIVHHEEAFRLPLLDPSGPARVSSPHPGIEIFTFPCFWQIYLPIRALPLLTFPDKCQIHAGSNINVCSDPIVGRRNMSLTTSIFGEEYVTGQKCLARAVTKLDIDATGEGNDPTPMGRAVVVSDLWSEIVSKQQARGRPSGIEKLWGLARIQRLKMRLTISAWVESIKLHFVLFAEC